MHILKADSIRDAETLSILAQEIWEEHYTPIIGAAQVAYMLQNFQSRDKIYEDMTQNHYHYYIAWDGEIPVGYLGIQPQDGELYFSKLYVKKDHRGQGLSRRFLKIAVGFAQSQRLPSIYLTVNKHNEDSIAVYRRLGFATEQAVVSDIGAGYVMDDYIMRMAVPLGSMSPEGVSVDFGGGGEPRYVVVAARSGRDWLFVRHESRDTYEFPGGHIGPEKSRRTPQGGNLGGDRRHGFRASVHLPLPGDRRGQNHCRPALFRRGEDHGRSARSGDPEGDPLPGTARLSYLSRHPAHPFSPGSGFSGDG